MLIQSNHFSIHFGTKSDAIFPTDPITRSLASNAPLTVPTLAHVAKKLTITDLILPHQVHGIHGHIVEHDKPLPGANLMVDGDYLITSTAYLGLATLTADCLPVVAYDNHNHALGVAHAGWRGAVAGILPRMLEHMKQEYNTGQKDVTIFIGPGARECCYEVKQDFIDQASAYSPLDTSLTVRNSRFYFDLPRFACSQLTAYGIKEDQINMDYNQCTICNHAYFSHRRECEKSGRNITIATLQMR